MGYYSDIALCLDKNGKVLLEKSLKKSAPEIREEVINLMAGAKNHLVNSQTSSELWY